MRASSFISLFIIWFAGLALLASPVFANLPEVDSSNKLSAPAEKALKSADSLVLYSLEPYTENIGDENNWKGARFHGYICLGKVALTGKAAQKAIAEFKSVVPKERQPMANCFDPRHALSIVSGNHTYDFLLCFQCAQMVVYEDGKEIDVVSANGSADILNGLLKRAEIPVSFVFSEAYIKKEKAEQ